MSVSTSARATASQGQIALTTGVIGHATNAPVSRIHPTSAANDDAEKIAGESMVNPLWMITIGLGTFFVLALLLLSSD